MDHELVRLVPLPDIWPGEHYLLAHFDTPDDARQFESHLDKPVPAQYLAGLTVDEALAKLTATLLDSVYGHHDLLDLRGAYLDRS